MSLSWNLIVYLSLMSLPFVVPSIGVSPLGPFDHAAELLAILL